MKVPVIINPADFESLFRYNFRPLCLYALHYMGDVEASEDIVQECFMKLWEKLEKWGLEEITSDEIILKPYLLKKYRQNKR